MPIKLIIIVAVVTAVAVNYYQDKSFSPFEPGVVKSAEKIAGTVGKSVLGVATKIASSVASQSAKKAEHIIIKATVPGLVSQIDKLPEQDQKEIKKAICK